MGADRPSSEAIEALHEARAAEKAQTLFYRRLAGLAEAADDAATAERLNGLLADEQHHLSRLTARLLELGENVEELRDAAAPETALARWEHVAREREQVEVSRYGRLLEEADERLDPQTRELVAAILETEKHHAEELGGKWTDA